MPVITFTGAGGVPFARINYCQMMRAKGSMGNITGMDMGGTGQRDPKGAGIKGMDMKGSSGDMEGLNMLGRQPSKQPRTRP